MVLFCVCRIHPPHVIVIQFHPSVCCHSDWEGERPSGGWEVVASLGYLIGSQTVKMVHPHARLLLLILPLLLVSMCRYVWRNLGSSVSSISCLVPPSFCLSHSLGGRSEICCLRRDIALYQVAISPRRPKSTTYFLKKLFSALLPIEHFTHTLFLVYPFGFKQTNTH